MSSIDLRKTVELTRQFKAASICRFATPLATIAAGQRCHVGSEASQLRQWTDLVCKLLSLGMTPGIDTLDIGSTAANFNSME
jgi:hypothetical protein